MKSQMKSAAYGLCIVLCVFTAAAGQGERGAITGVVRDASGAFIPEVTVTATNVATNVESTAKTTDAGVYRLSSVEPGTYRLSSSTSGFKTGIVEGVTVGVAQTATIDFSLEVGQIGETVTVTAESLIETSTSEVGRYVSANEFQSWPIPVADGLRQLQSFIFRSLPGAVGGEFQGSINGGQFYSHEILVEGISLGRYDLSGGSMNEFTPSADATSEFRLQAGTLSAQYGNTQTSMANFGMKSGTNEFHGSAYHYLQNEALNANASTANFSGVKRQPFKLNNFGGTLGGPVFLPRFGQGGPALYKGKDKTFFFVFYEGTRQRNFRSTSFTTLPTVAMKQGDFSALLNPAFTGNSRSGTQIGVDALNRSVIFGQLYDPRTTRRVGTSVVRDPFPGNIIPQSQWSAVSANVLRLAPIPDPIFPTFLSNYPTLGSGQPVFGLDNIGVKINHVFNERHKFSTFYNWNTRPRDNSPGGRYGPRPGSATSVFQFQEVGGRMARISEDWTISSTKLNHFAFGFNRFINPNNSAFVDEDWPQQIGLQGVPGTHFPRLRFRGTAGIMGGNIGAAGQFGSATAGFSASDSFIFVDDFTYLRGPHTFRVGTEIRRYRYNDRGRGNTSGTFEFRSQQTELPGFANSTGFAFA
ncbi:MAG: carboxypeptidase regulatory-like domain-containing protein, partial [Pyrinomonadaceae bacterium]|nr:carboxypeptidase regulatory-like domain-containing protein [Pyrinomonadaceae bacterium]